MVGILEHATFSNIKEQHKQLYADCLGPWLEMVSEEIERRLLPEARDTTDVYGEFNIAEKLKGSFEEQATALRLLVGRPVMTANEGRARLNLPSIKDDPTADQLAAQQGGPSTRGRRRPDDGSPTTSRRGRRRRPTADRPRRSSAPRRSFDATSSGNARSCTGCRRPRAPSLPARLSGPLDAGTRARPARRASSATEADAIARLTNDDTVGQLERDCRCRVSRTRTITSPRSRSSTRGR